MQFLNTDAIFCGYNPGDLMPVRLTEAAELDAVTSSVTFAVTTGSSQVIVGEFSGQLLQDR